MFVYGSAGVRIKGKPSDWIDLAAAADPLRGSLGGHTLKKKKQVLPLKWNVMNEEEKENWSNGFEKYGNEDHV